MNFEFNLLLIIGLLTVAAAVVAGFRQYRERYGWVFVCYGISELSALIFLAVFSLRGNQWYIVMLIPVIYGFIFRKFSKEHLVFILLISVLTLFVLPGSPESQLLIMAIAHIAVFLFLSYDALMDMLVKEELNLFYILFLLFEVNAITKLLFILFKVNLSVVYYYPSGIFTVLLYFYFIFFSYNSPGLRIRIKPVHTVHK